MAKGIFSIGGTKCVVFIDKKNTIESLVDLSRTL